jgi:oxygen-independent coproporphyrinogen-3 oxidase
MVSMTLGIYISVPFCRTKCSYCNFASDVFSRAVFERYVDRVCADIEKAPQVAAGMGGQFDRKINSIYLGGGTPTVLDAGQLERIFNTVRHQFEVEPGAEVTVECAPGTLTARVVESLLRRGVNRVSLGVQSFVDREAVAVGRLHKRATVLDEIARLRAAGISNINIDLIAGLPHQTTESWAFSVTEAIARGVQHVSVYMLEVDEDSRLGSEVLAGGTRYHAHFVPDEDAIGDFYLAACGMLQSAGIAQYEISNFAREGFESRHNLKYWTRQPYFGFGVDAHSMLLANREGYDFRGREKRRVAREGLSQALKRGPILNDLTARVELVPFPNPIDTDFSRSLFSRADQEYTKEQGFSPRIIDAVRFSTTCSLDQYMAEAKLQCTAISHGAALEESFFLGLRLACGVDLKDLSEKFGDKAIDNARVAITELVEGGMMQPCGDFVSLTTKGRLLSNEVFQRFLSPIESSKAVPTAVSR